MGRRGELVRRDCKSSAQRDQPSARERTEGEEKRTESKLTRMEPTLVAPTGTMEKKPWRHRPRRATRSLRTNRSWSLLAIQGETEKSSPVMIRGVSELLKTT